MRFTFGADPEIFVFDKNTGEPVSAHGMIPGDKRNPFQVDRGAVQVDGMALEFNIDPVTTKREFSSSIFQVMREMESMLPENVTTSVRSSVFFDKNYLEWQPEVAKRLGCEPDFNAYTGEMNPTPDAQTNLRTAAGHIHIGWGLGNYDVRSLEHFSACRMLTRSLDLVVGTYSVTKDDDIERRNLYGRAGAFRPKPYGCEYRVLSNFWLSSRKETEKVFSLVKKTCQNVRYLQTLKFYHSSVQEAINTSDVDYAGFLHDTVIGYVK